MLHTSFFGVMQFTQYAEIIFSVSETSVKPNKNMEIPSYWNIFNVFWDKYSCSFWAFSDFFNLESREVLLFNNWLCKIFTLHM